MRRQNIVIVLEGGMIQGVYVPGGQRGSIDVVCIDYDVDYRGDEGGLKLVPQEDGGEAEAAVWGEWTGEVHPIIEGWLIEEGWWK